MIGMIEMKQDEPTTVDKRVVAEKKHTTNCYDCETMLFLEDAKRNPDDDSDTRIFCKSHFKVRFGKKKKLIKRY